MEEKISDSQTSLRIEMKMDFWITETEDHLKIKNYQILMFEEFEIVLPACPYLL